MIYISGFVICGIIIFFAGRKLAFLGDQLADITGMGKGWVGLIILASITSLPELMVGVSSSAIVESADLAVGDILGSCAFNLGILAMLDAFVPKHKPLFGLASQNNILAAGLSIILMGMVGMALYLPAEIVIITGIGLASVSFIIIYFFSVWLIYKFGSQKEVKQLELPLQQEYKEKLPLETKLLPFIVFALIITIAAILLPFFTSRIADDMGLDKTFAGTLFLAISTSLPEISVSVAAVKIGAIDLAVGNLLGSNLFNILILAIDDFFYTKGYLLKDASDVNILSCLATIIMTAIAIIGLTYRLETKRYWLAWDALLIFGIYIVNAIALYILTL